MTLPIFYIFVADDDLFFYVLSEVDAATSGNYTCSARNAFGSEEVTYRVECASPPSAPILNLDHASHKEARLVWRTTYHPAAPPHGKYYISFIMAKH